MWINGIAHAISTAKRAIGGGGFCGWQIARRVAPGCGFGRVVFHPGTGQVNSRLASLRLLCQVKFATAADNGRARTPRLWASFSAS